MDNLKEDFLSYETGINDENNEDFCKLDKVDMKAKPLFQVGDKVRMKQDIIDELDREGTWHWHDSVKGKTLTISHIDAGSVWVDYYVVESPFCLAEKWLEAAE